MKGHFLDLSGEKLVNIMELGLARVWPYKFAGR